MRTFIALPSILAVAAGTALCLRPATAVTPAPVNPTVPAEAATYTIDAVHSSILFRIKHLDVAWNYGRFSEFSGTLVLDEDPGKCSVNVEINADSVDTFQEGRNKHVTGTDFFSTKEFPKMTFESKRIALDGETYTVQGDLNFHGVTKPVTMSVVKVGEGDTKMQGYKAGFQGEMTINRRDFGVDTYPDSVLSNEVHLTFAIEAGRQ